MLERRMLNRIAGRLYDDLFSINALTALTVNALTVVKSFLYRNMIERVFLYNK